MSSATRTQIFPGDPFKSVNARSELSGTDGDFDLVSQIQFVSDQGAVTLDFSAYGWVPNESAIDVEKKRISDEIHAFDTLLKAVQDAHSTFMTNAFAALEMCKVAEVTPAP